jgi:hypothetical protein
MPNAISFDWTHDPEGNFRLLDAHQQRVEVVQKGNALFQPSGPKYRMESVPARIHWMGHHLVPYEPLRVCPDLPLLFSKIKTDEQALAFTNKFGLLQNSSEEFARDGSEPRFIQREAATVRLFMETHDKWGARGIRKLFRDGAAIGATVKIQLKPLDRSDALQIVMSPPSLLAAIHLRLAVILSGGQMIRTCQYAPCGEPFRAGAGTERRIDAKFCCDDHRVKNNSLSINRPTKG